MYWYRIFLTADDLENLRSIDLVKAVGSRSAHAGYPVDFALFCVVDGRYTGTTYYLPPSAAMVCPGILTDFNAVPDKTPLKESLTVAVGEDGALEHWFSPHNVANSSCSEFSYKPKLRLPRLVLN